MKKHWLVVKKRGGGERRIPPHKWWVDRHTPTGEDAAYYERRGGTNRWVPNNQILRKEPA